MKKHKTVKRVGLFAAAAIAVFTVLFVSLTSVRRDDVTAADGQNNVLSSKTATITTERISETTEPTVNETTVITTEQIAETTETAIASESQKKVYSDSNIVEREWTLRNGDVFIYRLLTSRELNDKLNREDDDDALFYVMLDTQLGGIYSDVFSRYSTEPVPDLNDFPMSEQGEYYSEYYKACKEREKKAVIPALKDIGLDFECKQYGYYIGYMKKSDYDKMNEILFATLLLLPEDFSFEEWHNELMSEYVEY